jgi:hypothetical protein
MGTSEHAREVFRHHHGHRIEPQKSRQGGATDRAQVGFRGSILWQERSIEKATFVWADQKLITLDQEGTLMIAYPSPQGFRIASKAPLLTKLSWTPPTLVGTRLYIRDRRSMMAVDLG